MSDYIDHIEDKATGENLNLQTSVQVTTQFIFDLCHPVHELYWQLPGMPEPMALYNVNGITTKWVKKDYAGAFFRAEGGLAQAFEGQEEPQAESLTTMKGVIHNLQCQGGFVAPTGIHSGTVVSSGDSSGASAVIRVETTVRLGDGTELRPKNYTVAIWERTS